MQSSGTPKKQPFSEQAAWRGAPYFYVMRFRSIFSWFIAALLGAIVGAAVFVGYALPAILPPPTDLFMYLITSDLGREAIRATSGKAGSMLANVLRAFPVSVILGCVAGLLLRKFSFPRVFCYSALSLPVYRTLSWYIAISEASTSSPQHLPALQSKFGDVLWVNLCVYGWYFIALYISYAVANQFKSRPIA